MNGPDGFFLASVLDWLPILRHELLLFAAFWFIVGAVDEFAVDLVWIWMRLTGRAQAAWLPEGFERQELGDQVAVFIPAWQEAAVIGSTVRHTLENWRQSGLRLYVGCYRNDPETVAAAIAAAAGDSRLRIVIHERDGPTTKADCLNRLYAAMQADEARMGRAYAALVLQDAEDMVHPAGLVAIDRALCDADFVQLPVRPVVHPRSRWISAHYAEEFTESHAKVMVVRDFLGAALPAAGVGSGFSRQAIEALAATRKAQGEAGPFAAECLTEDYELGLLVSQMGGSGRFLRLRDSAGNLVATGSFFPASLAAAVRQKTRWVHGIALQGWDRLGWGDRPVDWWMALRDRRGPLTALVLAVAYLLVVIEGLMALARWAGLPVPHLQPSPALVFMLAISLMAFGWRAMFRMLFTAREYGWAEGLRAVARMPLANIIAIMAGRRALFAYLVSLRSGTVSWDKTVHQSHPAAFAREALA